MELKIKNDTFFVLEAGKDKIIFDEVGDAVKRLKEVVANNKELNPENVNIVEVSVKGEKWEMKTIPWARIAIELIRSGK